MFRSQQADGGVHRERRRADGAEGEVLTATGAAPCPAAARARSRAPHRRARASAAALAAANFPALTGRVVDQANVIPPVTTRATSSASSPTSSTKSGIQLVVATVASLEGEEIEPYANELFRAWKLGEEKKNNGVLLLVAPNEHRVRIEVGYGLEGTLTDAMSKIIIANAIAPRFKAGDFDGGVTRGVDDIITVLTTDSAEWQSRSRTTCGSSMTRRCSTRSRRS